MNYIMYRLFLCKIIWIFKGVFKREWIILNLSKYNLMIVIVIKMYYLSEKYDNEF